MTDYKANMKKNIIILVPTLVGHGMERMAMLASKVLSEEYNIIVVLFSRENQFYQPEVKVMSLDLPSVSGFRKIFQVLRRSIVFSKIRREFNADAVISFGTSANLVNVLSRHIGKSVISFRGYASIRKSGGFMISCHKADSIFCISKDMRNELIRLNPKVCNKTYVVYNGMDIDSIMRNLHESVSYCPQSPAFVSVGRLEKVKGYRHLLNAFKQVVDCMPTASLSFIGDGSCKEALIEQTRKLGIESNVKFLGVQVNPFSYIAKCDICVQTSITEGFMNVIIEAGVCGIPVISTDCKAGPKEILSNILTCDTVKDIYFADYGILVPSFDSNDSDEPDKEQILAKSMCLLASDADLRCKYAEKLRERANDFSIDVYRKNLIELLEKSFE